MVRCKAMWVVAMLAVALSACGEAEDAAPIDAKGPASASKYPLDDIPGLGKSREAAMRDDTIAYYEAWQRDIIVAECMAESGHQWKPEALFPPDDVLAIAGDLGVEPNAQAAETPPDDENRAAVRRMSDPEKSAYYLALYGEKLEDMERFFESGGVVPEGREKDFMSRGCSRAGWNAVPGIWALKKNLSDELDDMSANARSSQAFIEARQIYTDCLATMGYSGITSPGELEEAANLNGDTGVDSDFSKAYIECHPLWNAAVAAGVAEAALTFRSEQADQLESQKRRYAETDTEMRADSEFLRFLADAAGRALAIG